VPDAVMQVKAAHAPEAVLDVRDLKKHFPVRKGVLRTIVGQVYAVDGVSFSIAPGETLGLVGESGCGKSTVARAVLRLVEPTAGEVRILGRDILPLTKSEMRPYRRQAQIIFQDPFSSLNPRMSAGEIVGEPLRVHGIGAKKERREKVAALFERVGLRPSQMGSLPHQFSGGQRQRIGIARALALDPQLIVGDEPVSALDVSIQGQIINLLEDLQTRLNLSFLFIAHDLAVVRHISDRVAVMYLGRLVEVADRDEIYAHPAHPYTKALLDAAPIPDPSIERVRAPRALQGEIPSPLTPPPGCVFHTRCPIAGEECRREVPRARQIGTRHVVACHKA
jgi:oligopeptide/dipeptide ABC transporter ATP-binding protein